MTITRSFLHNPGLTDALTTGQVAVICGVSPQSVINWIDAGKLTATRFGTGPRRVPVRELLEYLKRNSAPVPEWMQKLEVQAA